MRPNAQLDISAYELLAQGVLMVCRARMLPPCVLGLSLRSSVDNTAAESVGNKLFTTAAPMKYVARCIALWAGALRVRLELEYLQGSRNELADGLSRQFDSTLSSVRPERRVAVSLKDVVEFDVGSKMWPKDARPPAALAPLIAQ